MVERKTPEVTDAAGLLDLLVEQVVDYAIFVLDAAGNIASWNPGAQRIKGYAREEIIGKPYELFFTPQDRRAQKPVPTRTPKVESTSVQPRRVRTPTATNLPRGTAMTGTDELVVFGEAARRASPARRREQRHHPGAI